MSTRIFSTFTLGILAGLVAFIVILGENPLELRSARSQTVEPPTVPIDLVSTDQGITVRLQNGSYSSTRSTFLLAMDNPFAASTRIGPLFAPIDDASIQVSGLASEKVLGQRPGRGEGGVETRLLSLGPVTGEQVSIEITKLCVFVSPDGPCEERTGSWSFQFSPGTDADDPIAIRKVVNQEATVDGVTFRIGELALSSSETIVTYSVEHEGETLKPAGALLEMLDDNGNYVSGRTNAKDGTVSFPPVSVGAESVKLRARDFLLQLVSPSEVAFDLPGLQEGRPVDGRIDRSFDVNGDSFLVEGFTFDGAVLKIAIRNTSPSPQLLFSGVTADAELTAESGAVFPLRSRGVSFTKDESGSATPGVEYLSFDIGALSAGKVVLRSGVIGRLLKGPWAFELPAR